MSQSYREVTHTGYFKNVKNAFAGLLFGLLFFIGSFFLLSWNEGNSVKTHAALNWAQAQMLTAEPQPLDRTLEDRIVYLAGDTTVTQPILDSTFAVSAPDALRLRRTVEMYQWRESKNTREENTYGGGTNKVTTYTYSKGWSEKAENSAEFHIPAGHQNPPMPVRSETLNARTATLGDYVLTPRILAELENYTRTVMPAATGEYRVINEQLYKGATPEDPQVGDIRVSFAAVPADEVSIIGQQRGNSIVEAKGPSDRNVLLVEPGIQSAESMFDNAHRTASLLTWAIRAGGWFLMYLGLVLILNPIKMVAGFIPGARPLLGFGIGLVSAILALLLSGVTIAIAWLAYRPLFSLGAIATGIGLAFVLAMFQRGKSRSTIPDHRQSAEQAAIIQR